MEMNTWRQNISHMVRVHGIEKKDLTIGKYQKIRLMHVDRRWANDRFYPFFTFSETIATKSNHFLVQNDLLPGTVAGTNYPYL
jgi:hypothetical protein